MAARLRTSDHQLGLLGFGLESHGASVGLHQHRKSHTQTSEAELDIWIDGCRELIHGRGEIVLERKTGEGKLKQFGVTLNYRLALVCSMSEWLKRAVILSSLAPIRPLRMAARSV